MPVSDLSRFDKKINFAFFLEFEKKQKLNKLSRTSAGSLSECLESGYSVIGSAMRC